MDFVKYSRQLYHHVRLSKDKILLPFTQLLYKFGISPFQCTLFNLLIGCISAFYLNKNHIIFISLLWLSLLFDFFDGALARLTSSCTKFGAKFDVMIDKIVVLALIIAIYLNVSKSPWILIVFILGIIELGMVYWFEKYILIRSLRSFISIILILKWFWISVWVKLIVFCVNLLLLSFHLLSKKTKY